MSFRHGDRVRWSGKTGTVLSEPRQCDYARGDPFTGVGVEVMPDKSIYGAGATLSTSRISPALTGQSRWLSSTWTTRKNWRR
jgi:hypothetical protein